MNRDSRSETLYRVPDWCGDSVAQFERTESEEDVSNAELAGAVLGLASILLCEAGIVPHALEEVLEPLDVAHTVLDIEHETNEKH